MKFSRAPYPAILFVVLSILPINLVSAQNVTVNLNSEKQNIRGFGGMSCVAWIGDLTPEQVDKAFGNGEDQLGFSILRIRVPNDASQFSSEVASPKRAIERHGAIVLASPWSPPAHMKSNNNTTGGHLNPGSYSAYADHLKSFCDYMSENGAPLYAVSVQNEPDIEVSYESCDWTPEQMLTFMKQNAPAIGPTKILSPESFQYRKVMSDPILNDPTALANMDILGTHIYGTQLRNFAYPLFKEKGAGKELWMTEHLTQPERSADEWPLALDVGYEVHNCMVEAEFNAYIWWYLRRSYGPLKENGEISKKGYCMAQYSKFARPGYVRVDATKNPSDGVYVSAYKGQDSVVIVAVNRSSSSKTVNISIPNTTVETFTRYTTSGSKSLHNDGPIAVSNGSCSVTLEAQSISTLAGSGNTTPPEPQTPFNDTPHQIPGRIEAEEYDNGGAGSAYYETDLEGNQGDAFFRNDQVDIEVTSDETGNHNICWIRNGEWLEYTVHVNETNEYALDLRIANAGDPKSLHVQVDGEDVTGPIELPDTEGWQNWTTVTVKDIALSQGEHEIRLAFDSDYLNLNYMEWHLPTEVNNKISATKRLSNILQADGFRISMDGNFRYGITDMKGAVVETGAGKDVLMVGRDLTPGAYVLTVNNKATTIKRKILKK